MSNKNYLLGVCILFLFFVPQLQAKFLITYGDSIVTISALDQETKDYLGVNANDLEFAYRYEQFGIFWIEIWSWGGEFCLYSPSQKLYWTVEAPGIQEYIKSRVPEAFTVPREYKYPTGLIILVIGIVALIIFSRGGTKEQAEIPGENENPQA